MVHSNKILGIFFPQQRNFFILSVIPPCSTGSGVRLTAGALPQWVAGPALPQPEPVCYLP